MNTEDAYNWRKQVVWGLLLIIVGTVVLFDRLDYIDAGAFWHYWPLLLVVVGINQTIGYPSPREFGNGLWTIFIGLWLFACFEHIFGLTFRNSWPLFILAAGVKMVVQPLIARRLALDNPEQRHEK
ncbi:MAG: LiaF transmembrane domain-containing protein [Telluria sp.]